MPVWRTAHKKLPISLRAKSPAWALGEPGAASLHGPGEAACGPTGGETLVETAEGGERCRFLTCFSLPVSNML